MKSHSDLYQSKQLHKQSNSYGPKEVYKLKSSIKSHLGIDSGIRYANKVERQIKTILDYGCGKGGLVDLLKEIPDNLLEINGYDPCVEQFSQKPIKKYDLVTCIDVLEHIDRENITEVLKNIKGITDGVFLYIIDMIPARKILEDGRNAHVLLAPPDWWCQQITSHFTMNISFTLGQLADGTKSPIRLIGCATNSNAKFGQACRLLYGTGLTKQIWTIETEEIKNTTKPKAMIKITS